MSASYPFLSDYTDLRSIYHVIGQSEVFTGKIDDIPVVVKVCEFEKWVDREKQLKEAQNQQLLRHPNVCRVRKFWLDENQGKYYLVIEQERMDRDLQQESLRRARLKLSWTHSDICKCLKELVAGFECGQRNRIAHRDVKPLNLFIHHSTYKISDFGSSVLYNAHILDEPRQTIAGSLQFLSPELSSALPNVMSNGFKQKRIEYNAFKSDVYSLGISLLTVVLPGMVEKEAAPDSVLSLVSLLPASPPLQRIISQMLSADPSTRPDFIDLQSQLSEPLLLSDSSLYASELSSKSMESLQYSEIQRRENDSSLISWGTTKNYAETSLQMTCIVCGQFTTTRYFDCIRHSTCGQACYSRLLLIRRDIEETKDCLQCLGRSYEQELRLHTLKLTLTTSCHYCSIQDMVLDRVIYTICGGQLYLVCSKACFKSIYSAIKLSPVIPCPTCNSSFIESQLQETLLRRSWKDIPAYNPAYHCSFCWNPGTQKTLGSLLCDVCYRSRGNLKIS